jgi:predicted metal-dependent phosphoesterase TrpH
MRVRGALHVHSTFSHDGTLAIADLVRWYRDHGYHFIALGEHAQDLDEVQVRVLTEQSSQFSSAEFCVIPGIEFPCRGGLHIVGIGATSLLRDFEPTRVIEAIHEQDGYAVLAHPKRNDWRCPSDVLLSADAAEIWNVAYDGKFLPSPQSLIGFKHTRQVNPGLLAVAGHDFHRKAGFYDVAIEMEVASLSAAAVLGNLRYGRFTIRARFFRCSAQADFSSFQASRLLFLSWQISGLRAVRDLLLRLSS